MSSKGKKTSSASGGSSKKAAKEGTIAESRVFKLKKTAATTPASAVKKTTKTPASAAKATTPSKSALKASSVSKKAAKEKETPKKKKQLFEDDEEEDNMQLNFANGDDAAEDFSDSDDGEDVEIPESFKSKSVKFSDEFGSGRNDEDDEEDYDEDDEDDDEDEELEIEKKARKLEAKKKRIEAESEAELQTNIMDQDIFTLPSGQQISKDSFAPLDLKLYGQRIQDIINVLNNFKKMKEEGKSRQDYIDQLASDLAAYYGYTRYLIDKFLEIFSPSEIKDFLEANDTPRPITIRTNTLKTRSRDLAQALVSRGVNLAPIGNWTKVGLVIYESQVPIGATPEYLAGHYMLQGAASFTPVMALAPQEGEKILDMCSAPGGKTTYISALMRNTGLVVANDANKERMTAMIANAHRLGVRNTVVTNYDGRMFPKVMGGFDRVLLDAPCSGLGVISRDPGIKLQKEARDIAKCAHLQKELILSAIDSIDCHSPTGGILVYCTCSIAVEENEAVVQYALSKRHVKVIDTGLPADLGKPGFTKIHDKRFHQSISLSRRFYPHLNNMDGFYVCKLKKIAHGPKVAAVDEDGNALDTDDVKEETSVEQPMEETQTEKPKRETPAKEGKPRKGEKGEKGEKQTEQKRKAVLSVNKPKNAINSINKKTHGNNNKSNFKKGGDKNFKKGGDKNFKKGGDKKGAGNKKGGFNNRRG